MYLPIAAYCVFFFKQKTAYEILRCLVGSEMCIRDRSGAADLRPRRRCDLLCELHGAAAHRQRGGDYGVEEQRWGLDVEAGQSGGGVRGGLL